MTLLELLALLVLAFALGYLVRRWHRPTGHPLDALREGEWRLMVAGGSPYVSRSVRGRYPVSPLGLAELSKALSAGGTYDQPLETACELREHSGPGTP